MRQDDRALTYAELAQRVDNLADALAERGVGPGDRVAWLGANDIATFEVFFATGRLGAVFVPLNNRLTAPEIEYLIGDCAPRVLVHAPEHSTLVGEISPTTLGVESIVVTDSYTMAGLVGPRYRVEDASRADVALADDAVILYTSGTTGRAKGAVLSHANLTFNTMNQLAHADVLSSDVALCISPLFHATGLGQVSLPTLFKGGTVVVVPRFDAGAVLAAIGDLGIASFSGVPTMLQMMAEHPDFPTAHLTSLRYVIYGGSPVLERVARAWQDRGVVLLQGYGMTEASPGVYLAPADGAESHPTSIGLPHFFTDVTFDPARGAAPPGRRGELLVRGPNVSRGYWRRPEDTAIAFTDGWYRTGDVVSVGADGWAYVVDRIKDMIISGGENIYPSEVEAAVTALPGVRECAIVATPDERWGEVGTAWVVTSADAEWTAESLREALKSAVAAFKIPKHVVFVAELPRTTTGKIHKPQLRLAAAHPEPLDPRPASNDVRGGLHDHHR